MFHVEIFISAPLLHKVCPTLKWKFVEAALLYNNYLPHIGITIFFQKWWLTFTFCSLLLTGSNINEVIRAVLNFFFFFYEKISHAQKAPKSTQSTKSTKSTKITKSTKNHQKTQKRNQAKAQNANKRTKIKNALKKHLSGKK